jgi:hypothetical protein
MTNRSWTCVLLAVVTAGALGMGLRSADAQGQSPCDERTIRGTYGIQMQGTRPVPGGGGATESVIGVVIRTYDGAGGLTQIDNIKGSVTGIQPDRPGFGTYAVLPDCRAVADFEPAPGILLQERMVIVEGGAEIRTMVASPGGIMVTAVGKRIDRR